jgi:hypothetical protein
LGIGTKSAVTYQEIVPAQVRTELVEELNVVGTLRISDKINYDATAQTSNTHQAKERKTAAWFLLRFLRVNCLIGWRVWHRESSSIDDFDGMPMPKTVGGQTLLGQADGMAEDMFEPFERQTLARLTIRRGVIRKRALEALNLSGGLDLAQRLPAGSSRIEHLPEEAQEGPGKAKETLAAVRALV